MKNVILIFAVLVITSFPISAVILYYKQVDLGEATEIIIVKQGDSFSSVADRLVKKKIVESRILLKLVARVNGVDKRLVPGRYDFSGSNSIQSVIEKLEKADFLRIKVTVPEGMTLWSVASLLSKKLELDSNVIISLSKDSQFLSDLEIPSLEGYLFPETYHFPWGISARQAVTDMVHLFHSQTDSLWKKEAQSSLSKEDIIKLASIVEAETSLDSERTIVASVYSNRLQRKMKLDADPTVIYGLGGLDRPLWLRDLRKDTPYNTYLHKGLPPTPINSPGLASIQAALNPAKTDYLYFIANEKGGHVFSRSNAEHNAAKRRIRGK